MEASEKASVTSRKAPRRIIFTFCNLLRGVRDEKEKTKSVVPKWILPPYPKKCSNFSQLHLFLLVLFMVIGPPITANYGLLIQVFSVKL